MIRESSTPIYLAGPTAVGKSAVALELARRLNGEIISVDSMQVYRGLDIGTAKPTAVERRAVPHHLIDVADLSETFDAGRFLELAGAAEAEICSRNHVPIYCGGTGLYLKALFHGVSTAPPSNPELRDTLERTPLAELLEELAGSDPLTYARIDRDNPRRVVRALEAIRLSGRPFSEQQAKWGLSDPVGQQNLFALARGPEDLRRRIDVRVDKMFADGLVEETRGLLKRGLSANRTAMQAIGYRQVVEHLEHHRSYGETVELIKSKTWQFSRRQKTWLRNQLEPQWIEMSPDARVQHVAAEIASRASLDRQKMRKKSVSRNN